ncbi:hypothetical protein [Pseudogemmobacter bohemicus]|uniref:hypothetical protein n=1 Tax=Pseudogemmobacter bohemicus TaxID=2250708 RepID=UPI000DD4E3FC|nr:hypothetical protein [Pseudogemmobacter bohemicus]
MALDLPDIDNLKRLGRNAGMAHHISGAGFIPDRPNPVVHARFNAACAFAAALATGEVRIATCASDRIRAAGAGLAMRRNALIDPDISGTWIAPAGIGLPLLDGSRRKLSRRQCVSRPGMIRCRKTR